MEEMIRRVCLLSAAFGIASTLTDDRGTKHIMKILCTCIMLICVLEPVKQIDFDSFSLDMAKYRALENEMLRNGDEMNARMNREVIENEYAAYIVEKARELGITVNNADVKTKWDTEGIWAPYETYIEYENNGWEADSLKKLIKLRLGIPEERQIWTATEK